MNPWSHNDEAVPRFFCRPSCWRSSNWAQVCLLTTLGIMIGVASVSTVIAALTGLKEQVLSEFESFERANVIFPISPIGPDKIATPREIKLKERELDGLVENCPPSNSSHQTLTSEPPSSTVEKKFPISMWLAFGQVGMTLKTAPSSWDVRLSKPTKWMPNP